MEKNITVIKECIKDNSLAVAMQICRWALQIKPILFCVLITSGCSSGYQEKDGEITFNGKPISDKSFIVLNDAFAKNDSAVWYREFIINAADIKTFTALDDHYAKDKNSVFYCDEERDGENYFLTKHPIIFPVKDAYPETFSILAQGYAKDQKRGYYKGVGFDVKDASTLEIIDGKFVKDNYQVYFYRVPVKMADIITFRILNNNYAKDTARVYYYGNPGDFYDGIHTIPCDANTFSLLAYPFAKDRESAFYVYSKIDHSDVSTFTVVGSDYSKDKNHVFIKTKVLVGADPETFSIIKQDDTSTEETNFSKDKDHIFWHDKTITHADAAVFKVLGLGYATDCKKVYFEAAIVKDADPATFTIAQHGYGDWDAEDGKNKYLKGKKVVAE